VAEDEKKPKQQESDAWLRKPSLDLEIGARLTVMKASEVTPELRKALDDVASELAKKPHIIDEKSCEKVTIHCPKVTISDPCNVLVVCDGY
jgi:hypothetical protein